MINKIIELKEKTGSVEVKNICESALSTITSSIYNGVTPDAKHEIENITVKNLFNSLSKYNSLSEVNEWVSSQKRVYSVKNLGVREAITKLNESKELKAVLEQFKEALDRGVHETRLYEQFISALSPFGYFPTVGNAIKEISDRVSQYKNDVDITKIIETMKESRSSYLVPLISDVLENYLSNKNQETKHQLSETLIKFTYDPFIRDLASIITMDATELQLEYANAQCDIEKVYSPVLYIGENEAVFAVNRTFYVKKGNNISRLPNQEVERLDEEFKSLCEVLSRPNIEVNKNGVTIFDGKNMKATINEGGIVVNGSKLSADDVKNMSDISKWAGNTEFYSLVEFVNNNFNEIAEIDFVKRVYLKENAGHAADIFKLRDNVFITTHNPKLAKSTFYRNVNPMQAKGIMMEHLKFDVTSLYQGLLPDEQKINEQIAETKSEYNAYIAELTQKINEFANSPYKKEVTQKVIEALQDELREVKAEYSDYLNNVEKYFRAEAIDEAISIDINVDGKKYIVPIPQEVNGQNGQNTNGTEVGGNADRPASAVTFDQEDTQLIGDTPAIEDDQVNLGSEEAESEAERVEKEKEEKEAEEKEKEEETSSDDNDIKIEDEADTDEPGDEGLGLEDEDEDEDEDEEKKKKKKEEPLENFNGLNKSKFVKEETSNKEEKETKKKKVYLKKKVAESAKPKKVVESAAFVKKKPAKLNEVQLGSSVKVNGKKGFVVGQIGDDLLIQVQGSTSLVNKKEIKGESTVAEVKPPFEFDKETLQNITTKSLFEQYVRCGIYAGTVPVKLDKCFVKYSDWQNGQNDTVLNVMVEGKNVLLQKNQVKILEDVNDFANEEGYVDGVIIDEMTGEAIDNVKVNAIDYTSAIGDADPVRIVGMTGPATMPRSRVRTLTV